MAGILDAYGRPFIAERQVSRASHRRGAPVRARYDAAESSPDNVRHWRMADGLSADAANSPGVRRILRNRARCEIANNSYLRGMTRTLANDVIGSGPRLQIHFQDKTVAAQVEALFTQWAMLIRLGPKLRTKRLAQCQDGEGISIFRNNGGLPGIQLDVQLIEAEQLTTPFLQALTIHQVDGIEFDEWSNPMAYHVLKRHPGDMFSYSATMEYDTIATLPGSSGSWSIDGECAGSGSETGSGSESGTGSESETGSGSESETGSGTGEGSPCFYEILSFTVYGPLYPEGAHFTWGDGFNGMAYYCEAEPATYISCGVGDNLILKYVGVGDVFIDIMSDQGGGYYAGADYYAWI